MEHTNYKQGWINERNTMRKYIVITLLLLLLSGCEFLTGKKITNTDPQGKTTTTYEDAPIDAWTATLAALVPALGIGVAAAGRLARNAARARDGMLDANKTAIDAADWKQINSAESFKVMLEMGQASHDDSKLLANEYKKWKKKRV